MPIIRNSAFLWSGQRLVPTDACELAIYQVTSGMSTGSKPKLVPGPNTGYSLPHNIAFAARLLDLDVGAHIVGGIMYSAPSWIYPEVENKCRMSRVPLH